MVAAARPRRQSYRSQLAYLYKRSAFYRAKLTAAGFSSGRAAGGLADIARLPLTEKHEIRATCTPEDPIGSHSRDAVEKSSGSTRRAERPARPATSR